MGHDGSPLPPSRGSAWGPPLWLLFFFLLLLASFQARGSELPLPSARLQSIEGELTSSLSMCSRLRTSLGERSSELAALRPLLDELRASLPIYERKIASLESELRSSTQLSAEQLAELERMKILLASLRSQSAGLSTAFEAYRATAEAEISALRRSRNGWRIGAVLSAALAVALGAWAAVK
jgi:chromosome segregation ATPase